MDLPRLNQSAPAEGMKESAQRVTEAQLRSQIRQQLIEEGLFDDVKDAAKGVAGAALEAGTKALLKKAAKAITGKDMPESKIDELETAMKAIIPALMSQSGSTFLKQLEKVGNLQLGKAAEKGAQKLGMGEKVAKL
jgi:predicted transcriptional regulator YheO